MAFVGMALAVVVAALSVLLVGSAVATLIGGGAAVLVGLGVALVLCVLVPALLERKLSAAFRRVQADAKGMFLQTLAIVNGVWLVGLILLAPRFARSALEQRGAGFVPGRSAAIAGWVKRAAALIPRSGAAPVVAPAAKASAVPVLSAAPSALPSASTAPAVSAAPVVIREAPEASDDTPAAKVYRERANSVVVIHTRTAVPKTGPLAQLYDHLGISVTEGLGSGFVVDAAGLLVTNHHVIEGATSLQVVSKDGVRFNDVTVLVDDASNDLALLSVPSKDLPVAPLSTAKDIAIGSRAIAIGCPLGFEYTLTEGIVSAHRTIEGTRFLQMQTGIAPGSSGGPLFDQHSNVIGVNTATSGGSLNLAVHVVEVKKLLEAPREPKTLEQFEQSPRMTSLETEGGQLDPTTRMNLREAGGMLSNIAQKCAKPLPEGAEFTVYLPEKLTASPRTESNLSHEAQTCMTTGMGLMTMQIGLMLGKAAKPPTALHITIADLPREDGTRGTLVFHFKR